MGWWKMRHEFEIKKNWLIFCTGVVPAISSMVRKLTTPAEKVLIPTPVYNIFFNSILNNGRVVLESPLVYENGAYGIDFDDLEEKPVSYTHLDVYKRQASGGKQHPARTGGETAAADSGDYRTCPGEHASCHHRGQWQRNGTGNGTDSERKELSQEESFRY